MLKYKGKISILLLSFVFIISIMLLQNNTSKTLSAANIPSFQTYEKIKIADDTYTVIGEENGIVKALMDSTTGNAQVWNSANTVAKGYPSNLGTLGSTVLSGTYRLPTSTDLTPITETNTLNTNIPQVTSDWWLGDASVDNRSKFVSKDNLLDKVVELYNTTINDAGICGKELNTEIGIYPTENEIGKSASIVTVGTSGGIRGKIDTGNTNYFGYYSDNACQTIITWLPALSLDNVNYGVPARMSDGKAVIDSADKYIGNALAFMLAYGFDPITAPLNTQIDFTPPARVCKSFENYTTTGYVTLYNGSQARSVMFTDATPVKFARAFEIKSRDGFAEEEKTCPGQPHNAGTASVRPMVALPTQVIAFANTNKRSFKPTPNNSLSSSFPTSDTGNTKPYLTLKSSDLNVTLNNSANGVSGTTLKTELPSDGKLEIPVSITGKKEGAQYISASANINGVEQYGVLKEVSSANDTITLDINNFSSLDQITLTLYVEDEGIGSTSYISQGTDITIKFMKPQTIAFDADQANTLTYGDTLTLNASTTSSDISTEPLTFSINDPAMASITKQNYDATNGTANAVITPKTGTGTITVTIEKAGDENVSAAQADTYTINLQTKKITVSAGKQSKIYAIGETMPSFTSECHDLVTGDTLPASLIPSLEPLDNSSQKPDQNGIINAIGTWKLVYPNNILSTITDFTSKYNVTLYDYDDDNTLMFETSIKELPENWIQVSPNANKNGWNNSSVTIEPTQSAISSGFTTIELADGTQSGASIVYSTDTTLSGVTPSIRLKKGTYVTDPLEVRKILIDQVNPTVSVSVEKDTEWATKKLVTITATDGLSGIDTVTVKKGNDPVTISGSGPYTFTASDVGTYDIAVTDQAGNTSITQKEITMIDTSKISIIATPETVTSDVPRQKITVSYQAGASGIKSFKVYYKAKSSGSYTVLDGSLNQTQNPLEWYAEMNGIYQFELVNNANETVTSDELEITRVNPPVPVTQITAHIKDDSTKAYSSNTWINRDIILNVSNANTDITETVSWEYSNDGINWTTLSGTSLEVSESAYSTQTIQFRGSTSKASEQSPKSFTVKIDKTSPNKPAVKDSEKYTQSTWYKDDVTLSVSVPEKASKIRQDIYVCEGTKADCDTNPSMWTQTNGTLPFTGNGSHELYFKTVDEAGNEITLVDAIYVNINSTKPVISIKIENDPLATWLNNATLGIFFQKTVSIDIEVNYGQGQSGNVYYIIEEDETKPAPADSDSRWIKGSSTSITPDAKGKVYVKAISDADAISYKDSELSIYADQTPPVITLPNPMSDWTNRNELTFQLEDRLSGIDDTTAMIKCGNDPAVSFTPSSPDTTIQSLKDGTYDITISVSDRSGNTGSSQIQVMIDTTAPVIGTPTPDISGVTKQKIITFTLNDVSSGIDSYEVVDSKNKVYTVEPNPDGSYSFVITSNDTYSITATDKVGNDTTRTYTETMIDNEGPDIANIVIQDKNIYRPKKTVTFDVTDALSSIQSVTVTYEKNGQIYTVPVTNPAGSSYSFSANENAVYTIKAVDSAGNENTLEATVSMIDTSGIRIVDISDINTWTKDTKTVSFAIDSKTGIAADFPKVMYNGSSVNYTQSNGKYTFTATNTGTYEILAEDQAGLDTSETLTITRIDKGSPTITNISNNNTANDWRGPQTMSFHASDTESGLKQDYPKVTIMIDGVKKNINVTQNQTDPTLWTFLAEYNGTYTIEVQDVVEHPMVSEQVVVDHILTPDMMTPIQVSAVSNGKPISSGTWTSNKVTFTISGGLDVSILEKYQVAITNGSTPIDRDFQDLNIDTSHHEVTGDTNGQVYWFRAYPVLSNTVSTPFTVNIDGTPPDNLIVNKQAINTNAFARFINFMSAGYWMNEAQEVSFSASDNFTPQADIKYFYYEEKTGSTSSAPITWKPYTGPLTYRDVDITLHVKAVDLAGNESAVLPEPLQIDSVPPVINGAKDQKEYKYYYVPRYITVTDEGSSIAKTSYKKDGGEETIFNNEVTLDQVGTYELFTSDQAGNEKNITFKIVSLPDIETEIDGSDESKKIINQVQQELDEVKGKIDSDELTNYEKWIDEATEKWKNGREHILIHDDTGTKVEGSEGTTFDPETKLVVTEIDINKVPNLPKNAFKGYDVSLMKDNVKIDPMGKVTVYLPYNKTDKPILYEISEDGKSKEIPFTMKDGYLIFETDALKTYVLAEKKIDEPFECSIEDGEILNKDTDGDGRPDLNIDYDGDCVADLNIDTNNDGIPDLDIDINGDGKPEYNIDVGKDGSADENIIKIEKWQPDKDCEYNGFKYDTMSDPTKKPDDSSDPDNPSDPDDPNKPDDPNHPDDSNNPDNPSDPSKPDNPNDSNKPNDSNNANKPNDSNNGSNGNNQNGTSGSDCSDTNPSGNTNHTKVDGTYTNGAQVGTSIANGIGGASTQDTSNFTMYLMLLCISSGSILLIYKKRKHN